MAVLPARICRNISSVHSVFIDSGSVSAATPSMASMASPVLSPVWMLPLMAAAVYRL